MFLNGNLQNTFIPAVIHILLWSCLTAVVINKSLLPALSGGPKYFVSYTPEKLIVHDFGSHLNFAKKAWFNQTTVKTGSSIYSLENHLKVTSEWAGLKLHHALPFGYSPTMLWILAPLVCFSQAIAFCIFNLAGLFCVWWVTRPARCHLSIGIFPFFSLLSLYCFAVGQTSLLTGAGLLFIAEKTQSGNRTNNWYIPVLAGLVLWALTAKPPLALTAAAVLIGLRQFRPLVGAVIITFLATLLITPVLGTNWPLDYTQMIFSYDRINADPAYTFSLVPHEMANLRGILYNDFGIADNVASRISNYIWIILLLGIALYGSRSKLKDQTIWAIGILSYLLFCSHVSETEELQIVLLIALCVQNENDRLSWQGLVILVITSLYPFALSQFTGSRMIFFIVKIFLMLFVFHFLKRDESEPLQCSRGSS